MQRHSPSLRLWNFSNSVGISHFELEGDALNVINRIKDKAEDLSIIGHIIMGIRNQLKEFQSAKISHASRKLNAAAHEAARLALTDSGRLVWFSDFPLVVINAVHSDLNQ